ncbi:MAG: class I SAM-dependent methyltransferase [Nanoarchaeota archaeon]|nr:class I SAM-dependent methyltransferase [Nanoarchaeota archaeon]MBU1028489.1 class I SAM-dependent methyltransferase [Nanoarchaeota archaeon]
MTIYNFKKVKGKRVIEWNRGRRRGLEETADILGDINKEINFLLKNKKRIKILEVGCGYGKLLLELKKLYGNKIATFGINKEPRWNLKLIRKFGIMEKIFTKNEIDKNLPKLFITDADNKLPFKSNTFDLVFSQRTIQYIKDKAKYLEELNRVCSVKGLIISDIQNGAQDSQDRPLELQNRWEIWSNNKKLSIYNVLSKKKNIKLYIEKGNPQDKCIRINKDPKFNLNLKLISSIDLHAINKKWWGIKSIYILK